MYVIFHSITSVIQHTFIDFILSLVSKSLRDYNFLMLVLPCCMSKCSVKQSCRALQETNRSIYFSFLNVIEVISNITIFYLLKIASSYQHFPSLCTDFMDKIGRTFFFFFSPILLLHFTRFYLNISYLSFSCLKFGHSAFLFQCRRQICVVRRVLKKLNYSKFKFSISGCLILND